MRRVPLVRHTRLKPRRSPKAAPTTPKALPSRKRPENLLQAKAHRYATELCSALSCPVCGTYGCVPAHYPVHRGMGSGKAGWGLLEWMPLCPSCHDKLDRRASSRRDFAVEDAVEACVCDWHRIALAIGRRAGDVYLGPEELVDKVRAALGLT